MPDDNHRQRLFFALWPDEAVRAAVAELRDRLARRVNARAVPTANLHLTLAFLGWVDAAQRPCIEAAADRISPPSATLRLDKLGQFRRAQVGWLGAGEVPEALTVLATDLHQALAECEVQRDSRPWAPHMTLFRRLRRPLPPMDFEPIEWPIQEFVLVESVTSSHGAQYQVLRRWGSSA